MLKRILCLLFLTSSLSADQPLEKETKLTFYLTGVECPSCSYSVSYAISQLKGIKDVTPGQVIEPFANVTLTQDGPSAHQIAQAVSEAPALHGTPYSAWLRLIIPDYKKGDHAAKLKALFIRWRKWLKADCIDPDKGEFALYFEPLQTDVSANHKKETGWSLDWLKKSLGPSTEGGLNLNYSLATEDNPY